MIPKEVENRIREIMGYRQDGGGLVAIKFNGGNAVGFRLGTRKTNGYRAVRIMGHYILEHRIVWFLFHGEWSNQNQQIDHINGIPDDNRIENLRMVSSLENMRNLRRHRHGEVPGVTFMKKTGQWLVRRSLVHGNKTFKKRKQVGTFNTREAAVAALNLSIENADPSELK